MSPRLLFGLAIRIAGLVFLSYSLIDLFYVVEVLAGFPTSSTHPLASIALAAGFFFAISLAALFGSELLVNLSYGREKPGDSNSN